MVPETISVVIPLRRVPRLDTVIQSIDDTIPVGVTIVTSSGVCRAMVGSQDDADQ